MDNKACESSLVRSEKWNRELETSVVSDVVLALRSLYSKNDISFKKEFVDGNQMIIIVDGYTFRIEVNKIKDEP